MVTETSVVMEAPTAVSEQIIDHMGEGFRKVFSELDEVMKLELPPELMDGGAANLDEIRRLLPGASSTEPRV